MSSHPLFFTTNLNPSITETIKNSDGTAHDLTGQTVHFRMRALNSATMKVDAAATVVSAPAGTVRYDWIAGDVDTAGLFLVWWQVTTTAGGKTQDMEEAVVEFRSHVPATQPAYIDREEMKSTLELTGQSYANLDIDRARHAASRGIDTCLNRRFYLDADANQVRTYTPESFRLLVIDDLSVLTSVALDRTGTGTFSETWTLGTDFVLEPQNSVANFRPYEQITVRRYSGRWLPTYIEKSVQVTGQFGWTSIPEDIRAATGILAAKLLRRIREAPFGIVTVGIDQGAAMRIARTDPDVYSLISSYTRHPPFI
jgi:hypothetical protein